jgi:hypothetical protein
MREALLIHVGSAQEAIKKKGYFKSYEEYSGTFADKRDKVKQLKSQLAELDGTSGTFINPVKIPKRLRLKPVLRAQPPCAPTLWLSLSKPWRPQRKPRPNVMRQMRTCSSSTPNFLSVNARYAWNKIIQEQTNANPYTDPQRLTKKGPRGLLCKS